MSEGAMIFIGMLVLLFGIWAGTAISEKGIKASCYEDSSFSIGGDEYYCKRVK